MQQPQGSGVGNFANTQNSEEEQNMLEDIKDYFNLTTNEVYGVCILIAIWLAVSVFEANGDRRRWAYAFFSLVTGLAVGSVIF